MKRKKLSAATRRKMNGSAKARWAREVTNAGTLSYERFKAGASEILNRPIRLTHAVWEGPDLISQLFSKIRQTREKALAYVGRWL